MHTTFNVKGIATTIEQLLENLIKKKKKKKASPSTGTGLIIATFDIFNSNLSRPNIKPRSEESE